MTKDKSKDLSSGQSIFRRELMEVKESEIDFLEITHVPVAEGKTVVEGQTGPCAPVWRWLASAALCGLPFPFLGGGIREATQNLRVPGESGDVAGSGSAACQLRDFGKEGTSLARSPSSSQRMHRSCFSHRAARRIMRFKQAPGDVESGCSGLSVSFPPTEIPIR